MPTVLLEYEAKRVLAHFGVEIPRGSLWPDVPAGVDFPVVAKVQVPEGGRGKRGGVRVVQDLAQCADVVGRILAEWPGAKPEGVYIEERIAGAREVYLAVTIDPATRAPVLLCGAEGGVEVESTKPTRIPLHPLSGWPAYADRRLAAAMRLDAGGQQSVSNLARKLVDIFWGIGALLVEVNPLAVLPGGKAIPIDARVIVDENTRQALPIQLAPYRGEDPFLQRLRSLSVNAVLLDGDIALIISGAGLLMATLDLLTDQGGRAGILIDLGAALYRDLRLVTEAVRLVLERGPRVVLINYNFQFFRCDQVAQAIRDAFIEWPEDKRPALVVRQRGNEAAAGNAILAPFATRSVDDLREAIQLTVQLANRGR